MENLNDVEFGSDENAEEAPILIAQRQLNIFRQVHIFNKAKRDQFDDELLALPDNVINYIKKMPGGRLLIEHLEEVKTNRGISFTKATSDEFVSPENTPTQSLPMAAGSTQIVGGSLTIDDNFAETFAKSMAEAFKEIPMQTVASAPALPADFSQFFEAINEEIRASRTSLLDVLKETRNITDSVIASQVSISKILEGILSTQNKGDTDNATMNNRIIASQASITKLLENLYTSNTQKNNEISSYLDVDNKLQEFRNQLEQTINSSLSSIINHIYDVANKQNADIAVLDIENRLSHFRKEMEETIAKSLANLQIAAPVKQQEYSAPIIESQPLQQKTSFINHDEDELDSDDISSFATNAENERKKKKKKKKKKNSELVDNTENTFSSIAIPMTIAKTDALPSAIAPTDDGKLDGVIHNSQYKHEDDFNHINLDIPPLDDNLEKDDLDLPKTISTADENNNDSDEGFWSENSDMEEHSLDADFINSSDTFGSLDDLASNESMATNKYEESAQNALSQDLNSLDDLMNDEADLDTLEQDNISEEVSHENQDEISTVQDLSSLDDLMSDVQQSKSDVSLGDNEFSANELNEQTFDEDLGSDVLAGDIGISQPNMIENSDDEEAIDSSKEEANTEINEEQKTEKSHDTADDENNAKESSSLYSAQLDKIREALTGNNIDISSIDEPIALDDYDDDANVSDVDEEYELAPRQSQAETINQPETTQSVEENQSDEDWEWEYVDENGNPIPADENAEGGDEDWEWEYVEDDSSDVGDNNKQE